MRRVQGSGHRVAVQVQLVRLRSPPPLRSPYADVVSPFLHQMLVPVTSPAAWQRRALLQRVREGRDRVCLPLQRLRVRPSPVLRQAPDGAR